MFQLKPNPTFRATVSISVPGDDAEPLRLPVTFAHYSRSAYKTEIEDAGLTVEDAVLLVVRDWHIDGVPFSTEQLREFLDDYQTAAQELFEAYLAELRVAKRKN